MKHIICMQPTVFLNKLPFNEMGVPDMITAMFGFIGESES